MNKFEELGGIIFMKLKTELIEAAFLYETAVSALCSLFSFQKAAIDVYVSSKTQKPGLKAAS